MLLKAILNSVREEFKITIHVFYYSMIAGAGLTTGVMGMLLLYLK